MHRTATLLLVLACAAVPGTLVPRVAAAQEPPPASGTAIAPDAEPLPMVAPAAVPAGEPEPDVRTTYFVSVAAGAVAGVRTPGFGAMGAGAVEWGVRWQFAPWYRLGIRHSFLLSVLPWSDDRSQATVGRTSDPEGPDTTSPRASLISGLVMTNVFRLGGPAWLVASLGPAFIAAEPMEGASILPLPSAGLGLEFEVGRAGKSQMTLVARCDALFLPGDGERRVLMTPQVGMLFVF